MYADGWRIGLLLAAGLACQSASLAQQTAMETIWTGAGGQPFWDLEANWSNGAPRSVETGAFIDGFGTTLRSGEFTAGAFGNTGLLNITGGHLSVGTWGSGGLVNSGTLNLSGGHLDVSAGFGNAGTVNVGSTFTARLSPGDGFANTGVLNVTGGTASVHLFRSSFTQSGAVDVQGGSFTVTNIGGNFSSSGRWITSPGAVLSFEGGWGTAPWLPVPTPFAGGSFANAGTLRFAGPNMGAQFDPSVSLSGPGTVEVAEGGSLSLRRHADLGALRLGPAFPVGDAGVVYGYAKSRVRAEAGLTVGELDWREGWLDAGGTVTVKGLATLTEDLSKGTYYDLSPPIGKRMDAAFRFEGTAIWDGNSDIFGNGSLHIAAGASFRDQNSEGTPDGTSFNRRPTRIAVASVENAGTYLKEGPGHTVIASALTNTGTLRLVDAGHLSLTGPIDNTGTMETVRSRMVLWGPLAQIDGERLAGGRYVMRDGQIVLNLGSDASGAAPRLVRTNEAAIVLDGPQARFVGTWLGGDVGALSRLNDNRGSLTLMNGALLESDALLNQGSVVIAGGSRLSLPDGGYFQSGSAASTQVDGTIEGPRITFGAGTFSAAGAGEAGIAWLIGTQVGFDATVLMDVIDLHHHDLVRALGITSLGGALDVTFADAVALGTVRIIESEGGIEGRFTVVNSNLDASSYLLTTVYGPDFVDLSVSAVPEPPVAALFLGGALLLLARRRRA